MMVDDGPQDHIDMGAPYASVMQRDLSATPWRDLTGGKSRFTGQRYTKGQCLIAS